MTAARSLFWNYGGSIAQLTVQLGCTAVSSRLVAPSQFGAYATAMTVATLLGYFAGSGIATCLLRANEITFALLRTSAVLAVITGFGCAVAGQLLAPLVAAGMRMPEAEGMLRLAALQFLAQPSALAATAALRRLGRTRTAVRIELGGQIIGSIGSLGLLAAGWNPYAIAVAGPLTAVVTLSLTIVPLINGSIPWGRKVKVRALLGGTSFFTIYGLVQSITNNAPLWLVGARIGPTAAGHFSRAYLLCGLPLTALAQGLNRAAMPAVAEVRGACSAREPGSELTGSRMLRAVQDVLFTASAAGLLSLGVLAGVGPSLLLTLLGPGWVTAADLVPVVAAGSTLSLMLSTGNVLDQVRRDPGACIRNQCAVIVTTGVLLAAAWSHHSLPLCATAVAAGPVAGLVVQHLHWRRNRVLPLRPLLAAHAVHFLIAVCLAIAGQLGSYGASPLRGTLTGCAAMIPVLMVCAALRTVMPMYSVARRHGLLRGGA